jgi:histone demethylase JARID1
MGYCVFVNFFAAAELTSKIQLNLNEAVNFALPDWLPFGRDCVQRYREHRKLPVFSHDELLVTITQQSQSISTAMW